MHLLLEALPLSELGPHLTGEITYDGPELLEKAGHFLQHNRQVKSLYCSSTIRSSSHEHVLLLWECYLQVELPPLQQLNQPLLPHGTEVLVLDGEAGRLHSAQQHVLQAPLLEDGQVLLQQLLKQLPVDLRLHLEVLLSRGREEGRSFQVITMENNNN